MSLLLKIRAMGEPMRTFKLLALVVAACSAIETASAQQKGDRIVTITDALLRSQDGATTTIDKGNGLTVKYVSHDRFYVAWIGATGSVEGWINRSDVIPFSQSLDFFGKELKRSPTARTYAIRATIWYEKHDYDKAIADWSEAIRLEPNQPSAYVERGSVWFDKKEYDKAISDYTEVIRLNPKSGVAYGNRGSAWWAKEEYDRAIPDYVEALRFDPGHAFDYIHRGCVWKDRAQYDEARFSYDTATPMNPRTGIFLIIRNPRPWNKEDFDPQILQDTNAIRINPKNVTAYISRAKSFIDLLKYDEAIADYEAVIRLDPKNAEPWNELAWVAATCIKSRGRDGQKAVKYATKACDLTGWKDWRLLDTLAVAHAEVGDFTSAVKWEEEALERLAKATNVQFRALYERDFRARLSLFKAHKSYHEEAKK
jgi:tetratricopeptide (TPR) repeat protein